MLKRTSSGYLRILRGPVPAASENLQSNGYVVLRQVFTQPEVSALVADVERVFAQYPPNEREEGLIGVGSSPFRYEVLNRSAVVQDAVANSRVLSTIEPLIGEDCHVIANTAWWQPPGENDHLGRFWHIDSGPHVPRAPGVPWDERIPYPIFAIATHIYLQDCPLEAGATGVVPGSHTSGQPPPKDKMDDPDLAWEGRGVVPLVAQAGDVALFVSDIWHRRLPLGTHDPGRMFIQCHYGRRDVAQRLRPTSSVSHLSEEAEARAVTPRQRSLVGLHPLSFYDG